MATAFTAGMGSLWIQRDGPNTQPQWLGCHLLGDTDIPKGDIELIYCVDPSGPNRHKVVGSIKGAAGAITTSITYQLQDVFDFMERLDCPYTLFVNMVKSGPMNLFSNADRRFIFVNAQNTSEGLTGLTARSPDDNTRSDGTADISAEELLRTIEQTVTRQSISETQSIVGITFCNEAQCRTDENIARDICEVGFASTVADTGVAANVLSTTNGATWTATSADPFAADEDCGGIVCFELGRDETRVIVARGETDGSNPAEIAYSDDSGATWTNVNVGSTNGQFNEFNLAMFALDRNNVWCGTDDGYIYKSEDAGLTWTAQESGSITTAGITCIRFVDEDVGWACGEGNIVMRTVDGGTSWSAVTGPTAQAGVDAHVVEPLDRNRAWIGYEDGDLYYTVDAGVDGWNARSFTGSGVGVVQDIRFHNEQHGYLLRDNASPVANVLETVDGGYSWSGLTTPTNSGGTQLWVCDDWNFYISGLANASTGYIAKGTV
jgi:photosystem II stability/assembly factor-like uncharacterized protein